MECHGQRNIVAEAFPDSIKTAEQWKDSIIHRTGKHRKHLEIKDSLPQKRRKHSGHIGHAYETARKACRSQRTK